MARAAKPRVTNRRAQRAGERSVTRKCSFFVPDLSPARSARRLVSRGFAARATSFSATSFITTKMRACSQANFIRISIQQCKVPVSYPDVSLLQKAMGAQGRKGRHPFFFFFYCPSLRTRHHSLAGAKRLRRRQVQKYFNRSQALHLTFLGQS